MFWATSQKRLGLLTAKMLITAVFLPFTAALCLRGPGKQRGGKPQGSMGLPQTAIAHVLAAGAGMLLLAGLWTPISGAVLALVELWIGLSPGGDPWVPIVLGSLGAALALIGPGAWSLDARFFGRRRIDIRNQR
jgi:uncharacterized membrane protein YphA (DoxX/SURF4 family)